MTAAFPLGIEFRPSNKKEQILYGALEVIADLGLSGLSHRAVAERAGVPLGSTTYHYQQYWGLVHIPSKLTLPSQPFSHKVKFH